MLPAAHHVVWFIATFLSLWGLLLIIRSTRQLRGRSKRALADQQSPLERRHRRLGFVIGVIVQPVCLALFVGGGMLQRYSRGDEIDTTEGLSMFHAIAAGVFLFALVIITRGLFSDAPKGRQRCPKCWYDMKGSSDSGRTRCPECGYDAGSARNLLRTRRHRRTVILGIALIFLALWMPRFAHYPTGGPKALIPTTIMIAGMWYWPDEWIDDPNATWNDDSALHSRFAEENSWAWQRHWAASRARGVIDRPRTLAMFNRAQLIQNGASDDGYVFSARGLKHAAKHLSSSDAQVRLDARLILEEMSPGLGWNDMEVAEYNDAVRQSATEFVRALAVPESETVVLAAGFLVDSNSHTSEACRSLLPIYLNLASGGYLVIATVALAKLDAEPEAAQAVLARLNDSDPKVTRDVWLALVVASYQQDLAPSLSDGVKTLIASTEVNTSRVASRIAVNLRSHRPGFVQWLAEQVDDQASPMRPHAYSRMTRLEEHEGRSELRRFITIGLNDTDADIRMYALYWIESLAEQDLSGVEQYLDTVRALTNDQDDSIRRSADSAKDAIDNYIERHK